MEPSNELCEWLNQYGKSLTHIEQIIHGSIWAWNQDSIGLKFVFEGAAEAVMFKLVWGGC